MSRTKKKKVDLFFVIAGMIMWIVGINFVSPAVGAGLMFWAVCAGLSAAFGMGMILFRLSPKYIDWMIKD